MTTDIPNIIEKLKSGIVKITFYKNGRKINSGSGFLCRGKLVSNNHVFFDLDKNFFRGTTIGLRFGDMLISGDDSHKMSYEDFMKQLEIGSTEDNFDYAVFNIKEIGCNKRHQFELGDHKDVREGSEVLIMGYPFGENNLTSHVGYVSSIYNNGKTDILQLDASTNNGNSGGPVVDLENLKVVGIVTRKQTGLAEQFDELVKSFDQNIEIFDKAKQAIITFEGINYKEALKVTQEQMKAISINIKRSANTGIGYAFSCSELKKENFYESP